MSNKYYNLLFSDFRRAKIYEFAEQLAKHRTEASPPIKRMDTSCEPPVSLFFTKADLDGTCHGEDLWGAIVQDYDRLSLESQPSYYLRRERHGKK